MAYDIRIFAPLLMCNTTSHCSLVSRFFASATSQRRGPQGREAKGQAGAEAMALQLQPTVLARAPVVPVAQGSRSAASSSSARPSAPQLGAVALGTALGAFGQCRERTARTRVRRYAKKGKKGKQKQEEVAELEVEDLIMPVEGMTVGELAEKRFC